ncbi:histidine phosphatase superfamily [Xylaria sp. FL0043]|nr:histidine phosphatase superfamily [Xylaria sp. FL0043]
MPPTIDIVRHAESRHNVEPNGGAIRDPHLTTNGIAQAEALGSTYPYMAQAKCIISSPMRRTIQTALLGFSLVIQQRNMPVTLIPELQESSARPSDMGSPAPELRAEFGYVIDLEFLFDGWWYKNTTASYGRRDRAKIAEKARIARLYISSVARTLGDDDHIVVVAHRGSIKYLIPEAPKFRNAELRSCQFVDLFADDDQALLAEVMR